MPGYYTHFYFSNMLIEQLPYAARSVIDLYPDAYRLGSLGFDILRPMGRLRAELDYKHIYGLFEKTSKYIFESGSKSQLAYMLGELTHYMLDSRMNPYIYYILEKGVPVYFGEERDFLTIEQIRDSIDIHIEKRLLNDKFYITEMRPEPEMVSDIAEMFEKAVSEIVGYKVRGAIVESCMLSIKAPKLKPYELARYDYMNRQKKEWEPVRNDDWKTDMSVEELFEKLLPVVNKTIDNYMSSVRSGDTLDKNWFFINYLGILSQDKE
ncbi:MAG: hypothetical protein EOM87_01285 [Clostridia bacterium]|nr:hypothetical protein [Clostridia bacterium]